jgi:hypothetical protein
MARAELAALVGAFVGELELLDRLLGRVLYDVEFRARLTRVSRGKHIEKPMQPEAGRRLWDWSFTEFREMVLRATWTALGVRRAVPANQPLDDRFFR